MAEIVFHKLIRKIAPNKVVESLISTQVRFLPLDYWTVETNCQQFYRTAVMIQKSWIMPPLWQLYESLWVWELPEEQNLPDCCVKNKILYKWDYGVGLCVRLWNQPLSARRRYFYSFSTPISSSQLGMVPSCSNMTTYLCKKQGS